MALCRQMGAQAYQTVGNLFYVEGMVDRLDTLYDELRQAPRVAGAERFQNGEGTAVPHR